MSKYTPGPWFYDSGAIWSESQLDPENKPYVFRGEEPLAAVISRNPQDARLIAAAPQMLEVLEAVAPFLHWLDQEQGIHLAGDMLHGNILAVIKAAKGEYEQNTENRGYV